MACRSGGATMEGTVALSLEAAGSCSPPVTVTVLVIVFDGLPLAFTAISIVAEAAEARVPRLQMTVSFVAAQFPWLEVDVVKVTPAGRGSVSVTPVAAAGPLLVTLTV